MVTHGPGFFGIATRKGERIRTAHHRPGARQFAGRRREKVDRRVGLIGVVASWFVSSRPLKTALAAEIHMPGAGLPSESVARGGGIYLSEGIVPDSGIISPVRIVYTRWKRAAEHLAFGKGTQPYHREQGI